MTYFIFYTFIIMKYILEKIQYKFSQFPQKMTLAAFRDVTP